MQYNVYDKNGKLIRIIDKRQENNVNDNEWLKGVTCFVINEKGEVLIEKRTNKGLSPGMLDLCSGHVDGDEVPTQAMIRELGEELGIGIDEAMNVIRVTEYGIPFESESSGRRLRFLMTVYCLKRSSSKVKIQKEEIDAIAWISLEKFFELIKTNKTRFPPNHYAYKEIFQKVRDICNNNRDNNEISK